MRERPILFSGEMVRAILEGRKTQTRRVIKPQPSDTFLASDVGMYHPTFTDKDGEQHPGPVRFGAADENEDYPFPYGIIGSYLWVRETFRLSTSNDCACYEPCHCKIGTFVYRADSNGDDSGPWKPSIFMPRIASRITLEIVSVRVERLNEISNDDIRAEGCFLYGDELECGKYSDDPAYGYFKLWESINGEGSWAQNPWVWVIEFKRL